MRTLHLLIVLFLFLFGCNNSEKKNDPAPLSNNIDYGDQGLELKDGNKITKFTIGGINIHGDTTNINYIDSLRYFSFNIHSLKDSSWCEFVQEISVTDSSYRKPIYTILNKNISLKEVQLKYPTSRLTGNIYAEIERHHTWTEDFRDTIVISGILKTLLD